MADAEPDLPRVPHLGVRGTRAFDIGVVLALGLIVAPQAVLSTHTGLALGFAASLLAPLLVRRQFPTQVFAVVAVIAFVQWLTGMTLAADAALLLALFTVASRKPVRETLLCAAVLETGCVLVSARLTVPPGWLIGFVLLSGMTCAASMSGAYTRIRRAFVDQMTERQQRLVLERDQQGALAAAAERARIAREMHDIVAHHLTVMIAVSDGAAATTATSPERAALAMRTVADVGREALADTRRLLGVLRDGADHDAWTPLPDIASLEDLIDSVRSTGLQVDLVIDGAPQSLPRGLGLTVYRLVQEALTNTMKHAPGASHATVRLSYTPTSVSITVDDHGTAPAAPASAHKSGHGLVGMGERVRAWDGELTVSALDDGWRVAARLPLPPSDAAMLSRPRWRPRPTANDTISRLPAKNSTGAGL